MDNAAKAKRLSELMESLGNLPQSNLNPLFSKHIGTETGVLLFQFGVGYAARPQLDPRALDCATLIAMGFLLATMLAETPAPTSAPSATA